MSASVPAVLLGLAVALAVGRSFLFFVPAIAW